MRDLHNHLLYGIDDGSRTLDESIKLLGELEKNKVTDVMFTPHYIIGSNYSANNRVKRELVEELKKHTTMNLYFGNEVYIDNDIVDFLEKDEISTLNGTRYILIEFPLNEKLESAESIVQNIIRTIGTKKWTTSRRLIIISTSIWKSLLHTTITYLHEIIHYN